MYNAEKFLCLAPEQYGSRKQLTAVEHALNKRLTFDILRQQRLPAVWCANDAKSCYDRIIHSVASLCMRRCGLQAAPVYSMFNCIQHLKHHIRTVYGTSSRWFGGDQLETIPHGVGQGNGAVPAIWAVVSTPILNMLRDAGFGVILQSSLTRSTTHFLAYDFVDDSDQCQTAEHCDVETSDLLANMQASLNMWEGGLR